MFFDVGPDFIALLQIFPPDSSEGWLQSGYAPPSPPPLSWDCRWRYVAGVGGRQACRSPPIYSTSSSHTQLIPSIYRGEVCTPRALHAMTHSNTFRITWFPQSQKTSVKVASHFLCWEKRRVIRTSVGEKCLHSDNCIKVSGLELENMHVIVTI